MNKTIRREIEVAFSKHAQPVWFRIIKYLLLATIIYFLWGSDLLWITLVVLISFSVFLHLWYRRKTKGWTRSYGMWKHEKDIANRDS
jgi:hypothetical protein